MNEAGRVRVMSEQTGSGESEPERGVRAVEHASSMSTVRPTLRAARWSSPREHVRTVGAELVELDLSSGVDTRRNSPSSIGTLNVKCRRPTVALRAPTAASVSVKNARGELANGALPCVYRAHCGDALGTLPLGDETSPATVRRLCSAGTRRAPPVSGSEAGSRHSSRRSGCPRCQAQFVPGELELRASR